MYLNGINPVEIPELKNIEFNIPKIKGKWLDKGNLYLEETLKNKNLKYDKNEVISERIKSILVKKDNLFEPEIILDQIELKDQKNRIATLKDFKDLGDVKISESVYKKFEETEEKWILIGKLTLEYTIERDQFFISDIEVLDFECNLEEWTNYQKRISPPERIDSLLMSLGYNSKKLMLREKIFLLIRIIPLVQSNVNIIELTKREVGKTYLYSHLFPNEAIIKNSTNTTEAKLFGELREIKINTRDTRGEINSYPVICFDEFHKASLKPEVIQELQMYAETGKVTRVNKVSKASLIFYGNIDETIIRKIYFGKGINIFEKLSTKNNNLIDAGFLDRIHFLNPTWGMRSLNGDLLLKYQPELIEIERFPIAYLSKIFKEFRKLEFQESIFQNIGYRFENMNDRNITSITKITLGLLKIIFPEIIEKLREKITLNESEYENINSLIYLAMEGRYSILKQIAISKGSQEDPELRILLKNNRIIQIGETYTFQNIINIFYPFGQEEILGILPHRVIVKSSSEIWKFPLDIFGIDENREEVRIKNNLKDKKLGSFTYFNDFQIIQFVPSGSTFFSQNNYGGQHVVRGQILTNGFANIHNFYYQLKKNFNHPPIFQDNRNYIFGYNLLPPNNFPDIYNYYSYYSYYNLTNINNSFRCECRYLFQHLERINSEEFRCLNCGKIHSVFEIFPEKFEL